MTIRTRLITMFGLLLISSSLWAATYTRANTIAVDIPANWASVGVRDYGTGYSSIVVPDIDEFAAIQSVTVSYTVSNVMSFGDIDDIWLSKGSRTYDLPLTWSTTVNNISTYNNLNPEGEWRLYLHDYRSWYYGYYSNEIASYSTINNWTITITYTIIPQPPGPPTDPVPADAATGITTYTDLSWTAAPRAVTYDVKYWPSDTIEPATYNTTGIYPTSYNPPGELLTNKHYYWKVRATNSVDSTVGPTWDFWTNDGSPGDIVYTNPSDGIDWLSTTPQFTWLSAAGATTYDFYLWRTSDSVPSTPLSTDTGLGFDISADLDSYTDYAWKVVCSNGNGTTEGDVWSFKTLMTFADWIDNYYTDPADQTVDADPDNDGATNQEEYMYPSDPTLSDTDGDGWTDGVEIDNGWDPLDPTFPPAAWFSGGTKGGCVPGSTAVPTGLLLLTVWAGFLIRRRLT